MFDPLNPPKGKGRGQRAVLEYIVENIGL